MTPSEIRATIFDQARRGYDTEQVDEFVRRAADALEALVDELAASEAALAESVATEATLRSTMQAMSDAREDILAGAHTQAEQIAAGAAEKAARTQARADDEAAEILMEARRGALDVIAQARRDADHLLETAHHAALPLTAKIEQLRAVVRRTENLMRGLASGALADLSQAHLMLDEAPEQPEVQIVFTDPEYDEEPDADGNVSPLPAAVDRLLTHLREIG